MTAWRRLRQHRMAVVCLGLFATIVLACLIGPTICGAFGLDATTLDLELLASSPRRAATPGPTTR